MNFVEIFDDRERLKEIFNMTCRCAKPGADKITYTEFYKDFDKHCVQIKDRIVRQKYRFTRFELFLKPKRHYQRPRLIFKTTIRDKFVAKLMCEYLVEKYGREGYVPYKTIDSVLDSLTIHLKEKDLDGTFSYNYFIRLDISSYFDSVNRELLERELRQDGVDEDFLFLVRKLCYTMDKSLDKPDGRGVPQGVSVSSILAERYLRGLDEEYGKRDGIIFLRYVDDILVLVRDEAGYSRIKNKLVFSLQSQYGLSLNTDKIDGGKIDDHTFEFLGVRVEQRALAISSGQMQRIRNKLTDLFKWYKRNLKSNSYPFKDMSKERRLNTLIERLNLLTTGYMYDKKGKTSKYGWILTSLPKHLDDISALKRLDGFVSYLIDCYIRDDEASADFLKANKKSFYYTYLKSNFIGNEDGYILDREAVAGDEQRMYEITCGLSMVDIKRGLDFKHYDAQQFKDKVAEELFPYFCKTLYIANRDLTEDILYW